MTASIETMEFQSEARQLLRLMIHSIYSNKDIFLRELISNASDALDKLRLEAFRDKDLEADTSDPRVEIEIDPDQRTLTVRDNGIGMTREDVIGLIGTIAKSGTAEFLKKAKEAKDNDLSPELIGQFGVGFYSSFMVADRVTLLTRRAGTAEGVKWESDGEGTYTIERVDDLPVGTSVIMHLKPADDEDHLYDYASPAKIRQIIKRYSDFITWPVRMLVDRPAPAADADEVKDGDTVNSGDTVEAPETVREWETVNSMKTLWARSRDEVSDEEYHEFYKHISHDWQDPLETIRMRAEGTFEYQALLFLPSRAPMDLFMRDRKRGVQLYVKRVFIMDDCEALMPEYLRFVKGVVDAHDLSLNVSREILQQDRQIQLMRRRLVKKVLSTVKTMMTDNTGKYTTFWSEFGRAVKEGLVDDFENREAILEICSFPSTQDTEKQTSLRDYVARMKDDQEFIYHATGESRSVLEKSPHMEAFQAKGYEVLLLTDPIDEMWVDSVGEFDGKRFQSIAKGEVDLDKAGDKPAREGFEDLLSWLTETLSEQVKEVRLSSRLTVSPACVVGDSHDMSPMLEKMYRAMGQEMPAVKRVLEINPDHALVTGLRDAHQAGKDVTNVAEILYGMAILADGGELADPSTFVRQLGERLSRGM